MYNIFRKRTDSHALPSLPLDGVWRVDGDSTYRIRPAKVWPSSSFIAVRTENGSGLLQDRSRRTYLLEGESLLFLRAEDVAEYRTAGEAWKFFWFEFQCRDDSLLPLGKILKLPLSAAEKEQLRECYLNLGQGQKEASLLSQAGFLRLVFSWLTAAAGSAPTSRPELIAILESGGRRGLPVPEIAREAGMCQRSFRTEIHKLTGLSPAGYITKMKMDTALEMLRSTDQSLQEISDSLHYGNTFYFSRVFKQYHGMSPGKVRQKLSSE